MPGTKVQIFNVHKVHDQARTHTLVQPAHVHCPFIRFTGDDILPLQGPVIEPCIGLKLPPEQRLKNLLARPTSSAGIWKNAMFSMTWRPH
jgi:hypothetical protein